MIPTYNEAGNITQLLQEVLTCLDTRPGWDGQVLVVDDHSPDGTAALVRRAADNDSRIRLLEGERRGLGHAYIRGFQHALDRYDPDVLIQMDADFSHAPADSLRLLDALDIDTDVVIGSRYTNGGRVDERWGTRRLLLSRGGNLFARYVAGLRAVHDCTAGFKAIRAECLKQAAPQHLRIQGYVFQVALLHALINSGGRVKEIPVSFADRTRGHTKLSWRDVVEFFVHIWWLRLQSGRTFAKFLLTGLSGVAVNLLAFAGLLDLGVHKYLASVLAMELSIVWNFMVNNYWTFRHRHMTSRKRIRGLRFNAVSLVTLGISFLTFLLLSLGFPDTSPLLHQAVAILPGGIANYFANSYWTFRPQQ